MITRTSMNAYSTAIAEYVETQSSDRKGSGNVYVGGAGADVVENYANGTQISTAAGKDTVTSIAGGVQIETGTDDDAIIAVGMGTEIDAGSGNDKIYSQGKTDKLEAGTGADTIYIQGYQEGLSIKDADNIANTIKTPSFIFQYIKNQGLLMDEAYLEEEPEEPEEPEDETIINIYQ